LQGFLEIPTFGARTVFEELVLVHVTRDAVTKPDWLVPCVLALVLIASSKPYIDDKLLRKYAAARGVKSKIPGSANRSKSVK
jgi:hypothetical protein